MDFANTIKKIRTEIYEYNIDYALQETVKLLEKTYKITNNSNNSYLNEFNHILNKIYMSMENKDYQLLGDILKFELHPIINKIV